MQYADTGSAYIALNESFIVPPSPTDILNTQDVVLLWGGLESIGSTYVLQPVLQYNNAPYPTNSLPTWTMQNYYVSASDVLQHDDPVVVQPGDLISINVSLQYVACNQGSDACNWWVGWHDFGSPGTSSQPLFGSRLFVTGVTVPMNVAVPSVLEVGGVNSCSDYPNAPSTTFSNLNLTEGTWQFPIHQRANLLREPYNTYGNYSVPSNCPYGVTINADQPNGYGSVTLSY
jgi:hypothetical protein